MELGIEVLIAPLWNWNGRCTKRTRESRSVLIAPLWNWNWRLGDRGEHEPSVLIAPLWNWNLDEEHTPLPPRCSNRTFMELKSPIFQFSLKLLLVLIAPLWNWNIESNSGIGKSVAVLIAPLWNWNFGYALRIPNRVISSNRTFMELK